MMPVGFSCPDVRTAQMRGLSVQGGRCCWLGAPEKTKLVVFFFREESSTPTISLLGFLILLLRKVFMYLDEPCKIVYLCTVIVYHYAK